MISFLSPSDRLPDPPEGVLRILCLGDVVGRPGRAALAAMLPGMRAGLRLHMVIANGENAAGGIGLTPETFLDLLRAGVDVVTSGNHIWKHREMRDALERRPEALRPGNYGPAAPGRGHGLFVLPCGTRVGVINLIGRTFMEALDCPFRAADAALAELAEQGAELCVLDFHAEATSEKRAMLHYLDGKIAAVLGTHTHVQTADACVTPLGTANMTDLGMCGVEEGSVLGMGREAVVRRFTTGLPQAFVPAKGTGGLNGAVLEVEKSSGKALSIFPLRGTS
jgi:metallophosphoesterase (TIGR00282 family)